jgi:hypothetical protein
MLGRTRHVLLLHQEQPKLKTVNSNSLPLVIPVLKEPSQAANGWFSETAIVKTGESIAKPMRISRPTSLHTNGKTLFRGLWWVTLGITQS